MIKLLSSVLIINALLLPIAQAAEINTDSNIKAVTVYPGSAKITRVSKITLAAGDNDIIINNLPINLNESTLRVSGEGQGAITLGSVELLKTFQLDVVQEQEKTLRDQIENLKESRKETKDALQRNRSQLKYIQQMVLGNNASKSTNDDIKNGTYTNLPLEQWQQAWQTLDTATASVQEKIRQAEKTIKGVDKELNKLKKELQQVATNQKETRTARLHVETTEATELTLNLSYQINGASWAPVYDADLNTETGDVKLKTLAQISQRTGEDWSGVNVTLSTLRPSAGSQLPKLNSWVLGFTPNLAMFRKDDQDGSVMFDELATEETSVMMAPVIGKVAIPRRKMEQQQSELVIANFSAEYKVPGNISLDSGSNKRRFSLTSQDFKSKVYLASAPRFDPRAMLLADIKYQDETPLLAGSLSLYRNGNFVGNTFLSQKLSGEVIKLSFGEDDKVKIKFLPDPDIKRKDGLLFGKKKVVERRYKISAHSNHNKPYPISIYDVIPVASHEDNDVKTLGTRPTRIKVEDKKGVVSWDHTLAPKKEFKLKYGYSVSYPEDKTIPRL